MSRLLSFVSCLSAAVSLIFLALSIVVVGPLAYANTLIRTSCQSNGNCRGLVNGCHGKTWLCDDWYTPTPNSSWGFTVKCYCDGHTSYVNGGPVYVCTTCRV